MEAVGMSPGMKEYRIVWEIDVAARNHRDAATQALEIQRDVESIATVFDVYSRKGKRPVRVDLRAAGTGVRRGRVGGPTVRVLVEIQEGLVRIYTDDPNMQIYRADWDLIADEGYRGYDRFSSGPPDGDFRTAYERILRQE